MHVLLQNSLAGKSILKAKQMLPRLASVTTRGEEMARKIPMRKCILTNEMHPKADLIRIVVTKEGEVSADKTGKKNGRGSYVVKDLDKVNNARAKRCWKNHSVKILRNLIRYTMKLSVLFTERIFQNDE